MMDSISLILRFVAWVLCGVFLTAFTCLIHRKIRTNEIRQNAMGFLLLWLFITSFYMLGLGLFGQLSLASLTSTSILGLAALILLPPTRESLQDGIGEFRNFIMEAMTWWKSLPRWIRWFSGLFILYSGLRFAFLIWALPPFIWDSLTYHLTNVAHWTQSGRIELFETPILRIYSPANYEVFATWFTSFLHHDAFVEASGIPAYVLAGIAVYSLGRQLGVHRGAAVLGAIGYLSTPAFILATTGTKNDPIMGALLLMGFSLILDISSRSDERPKRNYRGQLLLLMILFFYALGTKTYLISLAPGLMILGVTASIRSERTKVWARPFEEILERFRKRKYSELLLLLGLLLAALFIGLFWYVRNWHLTGNALFPYNLTVSPGVIPENGAKNAFISISTLIENIRVLFMKFFDRQFAILPDLPGTTGWGWLAYGLGLPAAVWGLIRKSWYRVLAVGFLGSMFFLYLSSTTSPFNMRYQTWVPALLCIGVAFFIDWIPKESRPARILYTLLFLICVSLNLLMTVNYNRVPIEKFRQMLALPLWEREAGLFRINMPEEYEIALRTVPEEELLGYNVHPNGFVYPLFRSSFSQHLVYIPLELELSCAQIGARMRERQTRWLFVAPEHTDDVIIARLEACAGLGYPVRERDGGIFILDE